MSDKQKSLLSLALLGETCNAALSSIAAADGITPDDLVDLPPSDFAVIHKDFISLLAYLYSGTTKTALSLKPSSPTYSASLSPLKDLSVHVSNLSSNVRLVQQAHGITLLKEMQSAAEKVVSAIQRLSQTLLSDLALSSKEGATGNYLANVGEVHHAIETVRGPDGLSSNNIIAVRKVWSADQASLADAFTELQEIPESGDDDDGWDELGVNSSPNLSQDELGRLEKVESIVKLTNLLHKTVIKRVLTGSMETISNQQQINYALDALATDSPTFPAAVDELISTVYPPQNAAEMTAQLHQLSRVVEAVQSHLGALFALEHVESLLKESAGAVKKRPNIRGWFETCFGEIIKKINQVSNLLQNVQ